MRLIVATLIGVTALPAPIAAHEIGITKAIASFARNGTYRIEIHVDPDALLTRLEVAAGQPVDVAAADRGQRIRSLSRELLDGIRVQFDDQPQIPALEYRSGATVEAPDTVVLTGNVPPGAQDWQFAYAFVTGWFPVEMTDAEGGLPRTTWIEGGKPGPPMPIATSRGLASRLARHAIGPLALLGAAMIRKRHWRR